MKGDMLVVAFNTKSVSDGSYTAIHELGKLRIIPFCNIWYNFSCFRIRQLNDIFRLFFTTLLVSLENEPGS